jgi:uncharacterized protein YgbK (DUF1537 family)
VSEVFGSLPEPLVLPDARARIRGSHAASGRRIAVLDDDPTGSQTVHDVSVVTVLEEAEYAAGLAEPGSTCFILTNTRSLPEEAAVACNRDVGTALFRLAERLGAPIDVVSRSDSTLRGHVLAEVRALTEARASVTGRDYDGVLLVPSYFEAGRLTAGDVHWARVAGELVPVGETEFARDATFGYASSDLREFVAEKSGGATAVDDVLSLPLEDIRIGGPDRVAQVLGQARGGTFVVVNATEYADLEVVVLGLLDAEEAGQSFLYRTGPSFVRALAGIEPQDPLTARTLGDPTAGGTHGLVVVGSHVGLTTRQLAAAQARGGLVEVELDVPTLVDATRRETHIAEASERVREELARSDVLLFTSRKLTRGADADDSLDVARTVSASVVAVVREARRARPAWVVAKGGITSHDVAVHGLGIRRAIVAGQLFPGIVSVFRPVDAPEEVVGRPYVVFAGNVGNESTLADVIDVFRSWTATRTTGGSDVEGLT